jgi:hypothetical protein
MKNPTLFHGTNSEQFHKKQYVERSFGPPTVEVVNQLVDCMWEPRLSPTTLSLGPLCQATRGSLDKLLKLLESENNNTLVLWAFTLEGIPPTVLSRVHTVYAGELTDSSLDDIAMQLLHHACLGEVWELDRLLDESVNATTLRGALLDALAADASLRSNQVYEALRGLDSPSVWDLKVALCTF